MACNLVVHELLEHVIVVSTSEHEFSGVQLKKADTNRPEIHRVPVSATASPGLS
jgi:hypothetical protein